MIVQLTLAVGFAGPERQVIAIIIAVVGKATMVQQQTTRIGAVAAGVPTFRLGTVEALEDIHGALQVLALYRFGDVLVVDPTPAVAGHLMPQLDKGLGQLRVALQRHGYTEHCQRQAATFKFVEDAPDARAGAVFVDRLHAHVAVIKGRRTDDLGQKLLGVAVAVQYAVFTAFFIVEHKLHGDPRLAGPICVRRGAAVAHQVAGIICALNHEKSPLQ